MCTPSREVCDGEDNDCDGEVDEAFPNLGDSCDTGFVGPCWQGRVRCVDGDAGCVGVVEPAEEICDGVDNDCDGDVDEGEPGADEECETEEPGQCAFGRTRCENGFLWCDPVEPAEEQCNGFDDDCDGEIDEGNPGDAEDCDTGEPGVCALGLGVCADGVLTCVQQEEPSDEVCDRQDNDCDGEVDEDDGQGDCAPPINGDLGTIAFCGEVEGPDGDRIGVFNSRNNPLQRHADYANWRDFCIANGWDDQHTGAGNSDRDCADVLARQLTPQILAGQGQWGSANYPPNRAAGSHVFHTCIIWLQLPPD